MILSLSDRRLSLDALHACSSQLRAYGYLDGLPKEQQNTIANVLYLAFALSATEGPLLEPFVDPQSALGALAARHKLNAKNTADLYALGQHVKAFKQMRDGMLRLTGQNLAEAKAIYEYCLQCFLDSYKWNILDVNSKSAVRRSVERRFRRSFEIDNLMDLLGATDALRSEHQ